MAGEDAGGCLFDELPLIVGPHAPPELAGWSPLFGELKVLAPHPPAAVLGLFAGHRANDAGREPPVRGREVVVAARDDGQADSGAFDQVDEGFEFSR